MPPGGPDARVEEEARRRGQCLGTTVTEIFGVGPVIAATVIGDADGVGRFASRDHFAACNGTAPMSRAWIMYYPNMSWDKEQPLVPLRALANPLRIRIVSLLTGTAMSATEVAEELGIAHASASYHLRQLASAGFLHGVADRSGKAGRGQPPRRYTYDPSSAGRLDRSGRHLVQEAAFVELRRRLALMSRQRGGGDAEVWLPREVWEEVVTLVDEAVRLVHDKAGPPHAEGSVHVSMTATLFELA